MIHPIQHWVARTLKRNFQCMPGCFALFLLASSLFMVYPQLDLWVSHLFYADPGNFPANQMWLVKGIYFGTPWAGRVLFAVSVFLLILAVFMPSKVSRRNWRRASALVMVVVLGIGLLVHTAAVGFALMSLGMFGIRRKRQFWLFTGLVLGGLIGLARISQGGHFLSDIVFSLIAVWSSHLLIRAVWLRFRAWQFHRRTAPISQMQQSL